MQKSQGSYEKIILTISALLAIGVAVYLVLLSRGFEEDLIVTQGQPRNQLNEPPTAAIIETVNTLKQKYAWTSPVRNGKPVPLNKSVLLVMKKGELFDLLLPQPVFRPPMTNVFVMGDKSKVPPEAQLEHVFSPNVGDLDNDKDGFTNLEEFNGKSDPRDDKSHPPLTDHLFLSKRISHDYIIKLVNGDGGTFQVQRLQPEPRVSKFVTLDQEFGFEKGSVRFKATAARKETIDDPNLGKRDAFTLTVTDLSTKKEFELVERKEMNLAEYEAELLFLHKRRQTIGAHEGKTFVLPGVAESYRILKIEEDKALIAPEADLAKTIEIKRQ